MESRSRPCQVISLNGWGTVTVYTAVIVGPAERSAAESDIGLRPGSRLKLVRTTQISQQLGVRSLRLPMSGPKSGGTTSGMQRETASLDQVSARS